ncbi:MAG TPA: BamA/TamA family outer membrane protein [Gemmatimonadales bacterium]|nr:BamA/TamA family outer membrane protein [Gemmatimonadales bacterium]
MRALNLCLLVAAFAAAPLSAQEPQRVVRGLSFEGNHAIDDYTLSTAIATTSSGAFATRWWLRWMGLGEKRYFNELEFRRDVIRLLLLYRQSGYMNAVIDTLVRREGGDAYVTFRIYEGDPVRLARLQILGLDSVLDVAALKRSLPLREGDPFNRALFQASADTTVSRLRNRGYPFADILRSFDVDGAALTAEATLEAIPGRRMRVGAVDITGVEHVDTATVRSMLSVKAGEWFRQDRLYQTQRDLYGLGMFRSVNVVLADTAAPPEDSVVRVVVRVVEAPRHRIRVGAGYGSLDCFRVQSGWTAYDFLGGARSLDVTGQLSKIGVGRPTDAGFKNNVCGFLHDDATSDTVNYNATVTLHQPVFLSPRHSASVGVFAERRSEFKAYTRQAVGANIAATINARRDIPVTVGYTYSVGRTSADPVVFCSVFRVCNDSDQVFFANRRGFAAVTVSAVRNRTNSVLDPSAGGLVTGSLMHSSRLVGSDTLYEFNRGQLEVAHYYPIGRRGAFAWRVLGGTIVPARQITLSGQSVRFVPPDQRFYAGGPNSVRGYARNELGPRVYVTDSIEVQGSDTTYRNLRASPTGGNSLFVANAELRFATPLFPDRMRVAVFTDVGQVWERGDQLTQVRGVRVTPGVGVRFVTPLGPVRLDASYKGYPDEPGPLYLQNNATKSLTAVTDAGGNLLILRPALPAGFWRRVVVQFAVGQAF